jgi:hypothetical protein
VPQDQLRELLDLSAVHAFHVSMLEERLGHSVPPHEVKNLDPSTLSITLHRWLNVLDMAVSPVMVRDALQKRPQREALEALIRIYILRASTLDGDRDKADFLATYLFRNPPTWHGKGRPTNAEEDKPEYTKDFEDEIHVILGGATVPEPPPEHNQLALEFDFIRQEVDDLRHFDQLIDSGLVQRVRDIKQLLKGSFYHPRVIARVASYNAYFGRRFDVLFRQATVHIKNYAERAQLEGASIMSRVDGDVIVKNLTDVEEEEILRGEYGRAQDHFRNVSRFKKAVDSKRPAHSHAAAAAVAPHPAGTPHSHPASPPPGALGPLRSTASNIEEGRIRAVQDSIQNFVRALTEVKGTVVPLRNANVGLAAAEVDAFRNDFRTEKSFRADYAACIRQMISIGARMQSEKTEYENKKDSAYLWKPHADALAYLVKAAQLALDSSAALVATAQQRGLKDKITAITATQHRLQQQMQETSRMLTRLQS